MDSSQPHAAVELFQEVFDIIRDQYVSFEFVKERDLVWTVQKQMRKLIRERELDLAVFDEFTLEKGIRPDLIILRTGVSREDIIHKRKKAGLIIEFKFEPSNKRDDLQITKDPVCFWSEICKDVEKIKLAAEKGYTEHAIAVLLDEKSKFRYVSPLPDPAISEWIEWGTYGTEIFDASVLQSSI